ncbi:diguanylate cyclase domain-containing protein [Kineococcus rubinsiae]|uniref:diguanylate cyclase domain-containing protein n=1 Tax=Kineococcus rubinsiae TaxID=2609562 RepID=UPI00142F6D63|nr:diguanylate cyclase [Kineococcus rubinsiae]NIZ90651.1 diguanylate cyclase [Kineococcus rubinsiae]
MTGTGTAGDGAAGLAAAVPRASVVFDVTVFVLGAAAALERARRWSDSGAHHELLPALAVCLPLGWVLSRFPMRVSRGADGVAVPFESLLLVYLLTTVPRATAVLAWSVTVVAAYLTDRLDWQTRLVNTGSALLSSVAATLALSAVAGDQPVSARQLLAVLTGAGAYYACDYAVSAASVSTSRRGSWWREVRNPGGLLGLALFLVVATLGYLAAAVQLTMPAWTALLMLVPILAVVVAASASRTSEDRRTQQHQLFRASVEVHDASTREDLLDALQRHGAAVVSSGRLAIRGTPPGAGEVGRRLPAADPALWLVTGIPRSQASRRYDEAALESLASLGAAALERVVLTEAVEHRAGHDELTGLPNRRSLATRLAAALAPGAAGGGATVLFVDLDGFKTVNDELGHAAGDELLTAVAGRLREAVGDGGTGHRLGGDEFAVLLAGQDVAVAAGVCDRVVTALRAPFALLAGPATIGASVGAATGAPGDDPDALLSHADRAMYRAKRAGGRRAVLADREPAPQPSSSSPEER